MLIASLKRSLRGHYEVFHCSGALQQNLRTLLSGRPARQEGGPFNIGLGLAISRWIVEAHNGRIWCTSENGETVISHCILTRKRPMNDRALHQCRADRFNLHSTTMIRFVRLLTTLSFCWFSRFRSTGWRESTHPLSPARCRLWAWK